MTRAAPTQDRLAEHGPGAQPPAQRRPPLRAYRAMAGAALRSLLAYPMSFVFGLLATAFGTLAMLYLWQAVLANSGTVAGFDWPQMKAYILITFVVGSLVSSYTDYRMAGRIQEGEVALDLVKPVDYQGSRFAEAVGFAVYEAGTAVAVAAVALLVFGGIPVPAPGQLALAVVSAVLALPLRFAVVYATGLVTFWTHNYVGVQAGRIALVLLLSGGLVPLAFYPDWLRITASVLPFAGMAATPAMIYVGQLRGLPALGAIAVQLIWVVVLWWLTRALWEWASRKLTVHGG